MPLRIDQMGRRVEVSEMPCRIVSLVPSQTELLYDLGLKDSIVGQTLFCIHPQEYFKTARKIGGTKKLNIQAIRDLQPDLIIGNKEENDQSQIQELEKEFPVWMSDIFNLEDALHMIKELGEILNQSDKAHALALEIQQEFSSLNHIKKTGKKALYFIWRKPYMVAGRNTFIQDMLQYCGLENAITEPDSRYPEIRNDVVSSLQPDFIFLSSEPYPFKVEHIAELSLLCPNTTIKIVDGEMFSWYGSRLREAPNYFSRLIS
jgi:ABC-type Fe3+-hydroxamate transport system substrate-binding protein